MFHIPVMVDEVMSFLFRGDGIYLDCTAGGGGHLSAILERLKEGKVVAVDRDPAAVAYLEDRFHDSRVVVRRENFVRIDQLSDELGIDHYDGIFFDLGVSLHQLRDPERGFAFDLDGDLDMRMDPDDDITALDLIREISERRLFELIRDFGEDPQAKRLARAIHHNQRGLKRTSDLKKLIERNIFRRYRKKTLHRVFQAFRIAVNDELKNLEVGLDRALRLLKSDGRMVCISYHSLEDRIVKQRFKNWIDFEVLTKKPIRPSEEEVLENPKARSAKLRAGNKR